MPPPTLRAATAGKAGKVWSLHRFWVSIRSYKKQPIKNIFGRILDLAWFKFPVVARPWPGPDPPHCRPYIMDAPTVVVLVGVLTLSSFLLDSCCSCKLNATMASIISIDGLASQKTDHGIRTPDKGFFQLIRNVLDNWADWPNKLWGTYLGWHF